MTVVIHEVGNGLLKPGFHLEEVNMEVLTGL